MPRAQLTYGVIPRTRRNVRDVRFSAIFGRKGITWVGVASSVGIGSFIPVRAHFYLHPLVSFSPSLLTLVCIHACTPRPQAIRCVIIRTLLPLYKPHHLPRCARWK